MPNLLSTRGRGHLGSNDGIWVGLRVGKESEYDIIDGGFGPM